MPFREIKKALPYSEHTPKCLLFYKLETYSRYISKSGNYYNVLSVSKTISLYKKVKQCTFL